MMILSKQTILIIWFGVVIGVRSVNFGLSSVPPVLVFELSTTFVVCSLELTEKTIMFDALNFGIQRLCFAHGVRLFCLQFAFLIFRVVCHPGAVGLLCELVGSRVLFGGVIRLVAHTFFPVCENTVTLHVVNPGNSLQYQAGVHRMLSKVHSSP